MKIEDLKRNELVVCADGFEMSVQAHDGAYCEPRINDAPRYEAVEVGFPSSQEELLMSWAESPDRPTETVYGWVPADRVSLVIAKHGGMLSGEVPPGIAPLRAREQNEN